MNARHLLPLLGFVAAAMAARAEAAERERNGWPFVVSYHDEAAHTDSWTGAGPFLFQKPGADIEGNTASGFRPFWVEFRTPQGELRSGHFLYPVFSYSADANTYKWSFFELVRSWDRRADAGAPSSAFDQRGEFEIFPLWFSRQSGDPELSYRALFPVYGTIKNKLGFERLSWFLFPLYVENEKRGAVTSYAPWPIVRVTKGAAHGWGVWPLFSYVERPGVSRQETYLWPLGFNATRYPSPDDPPGTPPRRDIGVLPFYARSTGPNYINEDYLWPFFGYTDFIKKQSGGFLGLEKSEKEVRYHETRYFWPLFVQGRGDERFVNRWAPFYTHSITRGYDKHWYVWPLVRQAQWNDGAIEHTRTQLLYFLYWNERQRAAGRTNSPSADLMHVWPLFSHWDNGAGRSQWQLLSPLDVFFSSNDKVRNVWTPLFAIARHERRAPGDSRTSLLWNAVTWEQRAADESSEFHVGPLLSVARHADAKRVTIGNGLVGFHRAGADSGWKMFWWDFASRAASSSTSASR
jgi:hypothetical protein